MRVALTLCFWLLLLPAALAGEKYLGTLTPSGVSTNNKGAGADGGFKVPTNSKITGQCVNPDGGSASTSFCVNIATCSTLIGYYLTQTQGLPTSTNGITSTLLDGGTTGLVSAYCPEINVCTVWLRDGTE